MAASHVEYVFPGSSIFAIKHESVHDTTDISKMNQFKRLCIYYLSGNIMLLNGALSELHFNAEILKDNLKLQTNKYYYDVIKSHYSKFTECDDTIARAYHLSNAFIALLSFYNINADSKNYLGGDVTTTDFFTDGRNSLSFNGALSHILVDL